MFIKTLFDKRACDDKLRTGWGLSFLVDNRFIFDTGEKGEWLMENMGLLGVRPGDIEAAVISHDHWDHWGGLWDLLGAKKGLKVYCCSRFGEEFKAKAKGLGAELTVNDDFIEIRKNIYLTGQIDGSYKNAYIAEQAMVIKTSNGVSLITGCAHPGIVGILETVKNRFIGEDIYALIGGFHLMHESAGAIKAVVEKFRELGVKNVFPTHCSGDAAEEAFKNVYGRRFGRVIVGQTLEI